MMMVMMPLRRRQIQNVVGEMVATTRDKGSAVWKGNQLGRMQLAPDDLETIHDEAGKYPGIRLVQEIQKFGDRIRVSWIVFGATRQRAWLRHCDMQRQFCHNLSIMADVDATPTIRGIMHDMEELRLSHKRVEPDIEFAQFSMEGPTQ